MNKVKKAFPKRKMVPMPLIHPNAGAVDIGDTMHAVAVPPGRDEVSCRIFGSFTCDLNAIVDWFKKCGVDTVAMESTGIYWKNLFTLLVESGIEVYLVNAKHTRNITGRKDDESDAEWIQRLHACGLLRSSFLPDDKIETLRTLVRHRRNLTQDSSKCVLRMQKSLESMNIKVHTVISDLMGKTGRLVVEAIIAGERDPEKFLPLLDPRIKAEKQVILKSLEGNWRQEHLFLLKQCYSMQNFIDTQVNICDEEIELVLNVLMQESKKDVGSNTTVPDSKDAQRSTKKRKGKNQPLFNTRQYLKNIHKVDVIDIYGINETGALELLAETGTDLSKWETEERFVSWLNLCPNKKISGGKLISSKLLKKKPNAASQALRMAANSLKKSNNWLGDYFRRMKGKGGQKYAIVATARKLAIIYYRMVKDKQPFIPYEYKEYQHKYRVAKIAYLENKLKQLRTVEGVI
jgi:transposase